MKLHREHKKWETRYFVMIRNFKNRSHCQGVRAVICEARGPRFNASSDKMVFFSLGVRTKMDSDMVNCIICIFMRIKIIITSSHAAKRPTSVSTRNGSKKAIYL